ncbi:hypothetical protein L218DRAFT_1008953 [Marasmius fiardii PR-910]|nr:hypothetical protein L218DRAFT_1008953 [Marasmius fiardii PR-910]
MNANYLTAAQVLAVQHVIIRIGLEFLFFGLHTLLYLVSTWLLVRVGFGVIRSRMLLLILTSVMFLASLGVVIVDMMICLHQASSYGLDAPTTRSLTFDLRLASEVLMRLNFLLGDVIVVWRTWVVWSNSLKARLLLAFCMLATIGTGIGNGAITILDFIRNASRSNAFSLILTIPPLVTNIVATLLIGLQVWNYRKHIKLILTEERSRTSTRVEHVLVILIESGVFYCAVWVLILLAGLDVMTPANNTLIDGIAVSLTGMYPTFIVIMVSLNKSQADTVFSSAGGTAMQNSQPLHFHATPRSSESLPRQPMKSESV